MPSGIYEEYMPGPVPIETNPELSRYLDDELHRIAELKAKKTASVLMAVGETAPGFIIDFPPGSWNQLFSTADAIVEIPECWASGSFTAPYAGVYDTSLELNFDNITGTGQGTLHFYAGIGIDGENPPSVTRHVTAPIDADAVIVTVSAWLILAAGQTVQFWAEAVNEGSQTQLCDVKAIAYVKREN